MRSWKRWVVAGLITAIVAGVWTEPARAFSLGAIFRRLGRVVSGVSGIGGGNAAIIANQITQIGHMVSQLQSMNDVLADTTELLTSDDVGMGNIGRVREVMDGRWGMDRLGDGLSSAAGVAGAFNQRIPGVTDAAGWLNVLANAETALVSGAAGSWTVPNAEARDVLQSLQLMAAGTRSYQELWGDVEAQAPGVLTETDIRSVTADAAAQARLLAWHEEREAQAATALVHAHAGAEAASSMAAVSEEVSRILDETRADDLMRLQRLEQAGLTVDVIATELRVAQAQLAAYQAAREAWERYAAEARRREERARWQAGMVRARQRQNQALLDVAAAAPANETSHRNLRSTAGW